MKTNQFITYLNRYEKYFLQQRKNYRLSSINRDILDALLSIIVVCRNVDKGCALMCCFDDMKFIHSNLSESSFTKIEYVGILSFFKLISKYYGCK